MRELDTLVLLSPSLAIPTELEGQACLQETKDLEGSLGRVRSREKTGEFYEAPVKTRAGIENR